MATFNVHPDEFGGSDEGSHYMSQTSAARLLEAVTCGGSKADAALERIAAEQRRETPLERATRNNFGRDPYQIAPDSLGHRLRGSDASSFDVVCVCCGGTDRNGSNVLERPCAAALPKPVIDWPATTPAERVAAAVRVWIAEHRATWDATGLRALLSEFARAATANGAIDARYLPIDNYRDGVQTLAVANGPDWTCTLVKHDRGVGVAIPRIEAP